MEGQTGRGRRSRPTDGVGRRSTRLLGSSAAVAVWGRRRGPDRNPGVSPPGLELGRGSVAQDPLWNCLRFAATPRGEGPPVHASRRSGRWCAWRHWRGIGAWVLFLLAVVSCSATRSAARSSQRLHRSGQPVVAGLRRPRPGASRSKRLRGSIVFQAEDRHRAGPGGSGDHVDDQRRQRCPTSRQRPPVEHPELPWCLQGRHHRSTHRCPSTWCPRRSTTATSTSWTTAVEPARDRPGCRSSTAAAPARSATQADDQESEAIGLVLALVLLLFMFGSIVAAAFLPLVGAVFSVRWLGLVGVDRWPPPDVPDHRADGRHAARARVSRSTTGSSMVARHREQLDDGMDVEDVGRARQRRPPVRPSLVAGGTVVIAILGLYVSGVPFVGALGLASAIVVAVTMLAALTLVPALLGLAELRVQLGPAPGRGALERRPEAAARRTGGAARATAHEHSAFARWGRRVSDRPWPWAIAPTVAAGSCSPIPLFSMKLGQLDAGTDPTQQTEPAAYDLIAEGFGPGANGPLHVVVDSSPSRLAANQPLLADPATTLAEDRRAWPPVSPPSTNPARRHAPSSPSSPRPSRRTAATTDAGRPAARRRAAGSRRPPTWSAPPPATSTSPTRSPRGCRG